MDLKTRVINPNFGSKAKKMIKKIVPGHEAALT